MTPSVQTRIRDIFDQLPARERSLAEVLLEVQGDLAAYSATELAARAGVSKATAARLFRRLGYADFYEMRQQARAERAPGSPLAELDEIAVERQSLSAHLAHDLSNLTRTIETLRSDAVSEAVDILAEAKRVWIVGFRNNHALALYARGLLAHVKPDVRMLPVGGYTVAEDLASLGPGDTLLALGFRRRLPVMRSIVREAVAAGGKVVLVADPTVEQCARHATVTLRCLSRGLTLFDSYVAPMSVLNYLCSQVAFKLGEEAEIRLERIEQLHEAFDDFD